MKEPPGFCKRKSFVCLLELSQRGSEPLQGTDLLLLSLPKAFRKVPHHRLKKSPPRLPGEAEGEAWQGKGKGSWQSWLECKGLMGMVMQLPG